MRGRLPLPGLLSPSSTTHTPRAQAALTCSHCECVDPATAQASPVFNLPGEPHKPYYMGCQGPSKGKCATTVDPEFDNGANWCGQGCGYDLCVQPGTSHAALVAYLGKYNPVGSGAPLGPAGAEAWLKKFSVNPF